MTRRRRRASGFTLVELLIAMALAGMVVAGALELHATFNRQAERQNMVAEMQQNLRVSMLILEKAIRTAGYGIPMGQLNEAGSGATSPITRRYGFQFSQSNTYQDPITVFQKVARGATGDSDPDWFYTTGADPNNAVWVDKNVGLTNQFEVKPNATIQGSLANFKDHDLVGFSVNSNGSAVRGAKCTGGDGVTTPYCRDVDATSCVRELSAGTNSGGTGAVKYLLHDNAVGKVSYAFNPPYATSDACAQSIAKVFPATGNPAVDTGVLMRRIPPVITAYRVIPASGDPLSSGQPKLVMRTAPFKTPYIDTTNTYVWNVIAENIDDMQIALIEGDFPASESVNNDPLQLGAPFTTQGKVCWQTDDVDMTTGCPPFYATAVRITLSARSSSKVAGVTQDTFPGGEDRPSGGSAATDIGYLHRSLTATINLRNMRTQTP